MSTPDDARRTAEAHHFDAAAERAAAAVLARDVDLPTHVRHVRASEPFVARALDLVAGARGPVLDLGGGGGAAAVALAAGGARVVVVDLSAGALRLAAAQAAKFGLAPRISAARVDALRLPFKDSAFGAVLGLGILHHLPDAAAAGREIRRVLAPGGRAVCTEPLSGNPFVGLARAVLPYRKKDRTPDERPLRRADVRAYLAAAGGGVAEVFDLAASVRRLGRNRGRRRPLIAALEWLDRLAFRLCPPLRGWARYVLLAVPDAPAGHGAGTRWTP